MSTQDRRAHVIRYTRNHSRRKPMLDLNVLPPSDDRDAEGTLSGVVSIDVPPAERVPSLPPAPIDVEELDDEVMISSASAFAEAKNNSRRTQGRVIVVDEDSEDLLFRFNANSRSKRRGVSTNQSALFGGVYINLEANSSLKEVTAQNVIPPKPKEPTFSCPVCLGPLVEEVSTKCGHIFCKACIKASVAAQGKCPTCRRKITMKDTRRVYLPATS